MVWAVFWNWSSKQREQLIIPLSQQGGGSPQGGKHRWLSFYLFSPDSQVEWLSENTYHMSSSLPMQVGKFQKPLKAQKLDKFCSGFPVEWRPYTNDARAGGPWSWMRSTLEMKSVQPIRYGSLGRDSGHRLLSTRPWGLPLTFSWVSYLNLLSFIFLIRMMEIIKSPSWGCCEN